MFLLTSTDIALVYVMSPLLHSLQCGLEIDEAVLSVHNHGYAMVIVCLHRNRPGGFLTGHRRRFIALAAVDVRLDRRALEAICA